MYFVMNTNKWMKWRGLVQVIFVHMFFSHHQTQVQGNKKGGKKFFSQELYFMKEKSRGGVTQIVTCIPCATAAFQKAP